MPTKKNFLGGQQNYNAKTGEYEPSLVGKNGQVVKDADGDGKVNERKKKTMHTWKSGKQSEIEYLDKAPEGYKEVEGALTAPNGYRWYSNGKSYFDKDRDTVLVKDENWEGDQKDFNEPGELESQREERDFDVEHDEDYERSWGPQYDDEKVYDDIELLKVKADKNGLDFERSVLNDIKSDPEKYSKFEIDGVRFEKEGNGWHIYEGNAHSFGTANSVANKVAQKYSESESKSATEKDEKYPKGTSKEYTNKVNKQYESAVKTLNDAGIKTDFKNFEEINKAQKEIMNKWEESKDDAKYKPLYDALEIVEDKMYNDSYIRLAPYGY